MAQGSSERKNDKSSTDDKDTRNGKAGDNGAGTRLSAAELGRAALTTVAELTGYQPESVTALEWDGEAGAWRITVDALELQRIPNTTDLLGEYVVQLDEDGTLRGYRRERRFQRGQADEG
jgi:hypothetical protein